MRIFCGLLLAVAVANCSPIVKRETEETLKDPEPSNPVVKRETEETLKDLEPLNEVYVFEIDDDTAEGENGGREKRKIGLKLGVANGVIDFVFGKLDSLLDAKTRAIHVLDETNKAKNAAFGIDPHKSATNEFIQQLVQQKIKAATGSIGPLITAGTTFITGASSGLQNSLVHSLATKLGPLSSLSGGGSAGSGGGQAGGDGTAGSSAIIGNLLTAGINALSTLSQSSGNANGGGGGGGSSGGSAGGTGINLGGFANIGGKIGETVTTTTEDTVVFDRSRVSLDIPSAAFGTSFTLLTNITRVLNSVILNSARRTQTLLEIFKPFLRGTFAIKGLPSDNPK